MIYLDHAAATPLLTEVLQDLEKNLANHWVNSSSSHSLGKKEAQFLEQLRLRVAKMIGAKKDQIFFCSSVTEANNLFFFQKRFPLHYFAGDHSSVVKTARGYAQQSQSIVFDFEQDTFLPKLSSSYESGSFLFCATNSQSGLLLDPKVITPRIRKFALSALIGFDCSQYFGHYAIDVKELDVDFLSLSSHKIGGPKGIAACYVKDPSSFSSMLQGGGHEFNLRSSTVSVALISGFVAACDFWQKQREELNRFYIHLQEKIYDELQEVALFPFEQRLSTPHITFLVAPDVSSDILMRHLEMDDIFVSSTSACTSKQTGYSEVFAALGIAEQFHKNILRISFCPSTTEAEVDAFIKSYKEHYRSLCRLKGRK